MNCETKQLNLLFVEDNADDCELLSYQFHKAGYRLNYERVDNPESFQQALAINQWHAVLCDHNMPCFDLMSALNILNQTGLDIPLIIVSGSITDEIMIEAMQAGAQDFIRKGDFARLLPVIERELREFSIRDGLRKAKANIHRLVNYDNYTGLPNREHLLENLRMISAKTNQEMPFSLVLFRLNRLPQSRFTIGNGLYQDLVKTVSERISSLLKDDSYMISHNCLAVIAHNIRIDVLQKTLIDLLDIFSQPFSLDGQIVFADISVGVNTYPNGGSTGEELLLGAEIALEHTDTYGVKPLIFYSSEMNSGLHDRYLLESDIHRALASKQFHILYQPQIDIASRQIIGAEALLRWHHPTLGIVSPLKFIPLLERTGLIVPVGNWVIQESCRQAKQWLDQIGLPIKVAVNLSVIQFYKSGLLESVKRALDDSGLPPHCLDLEITENIAICHEDATLRIMSHLKNMGLSLSMDDFGTGYSSLAYLQRYPIDLLKIDQSFVRTIESPQSRQADMLRAIIGLGRNLDLEVLAEGIETEQQAELVLQSGCSYGQGYLFSKPIQGDLVSREILNYVAAS
ncbi:MAG TPA: hypothetical protein DCZ48_01055 [Methylococcaceae bacterium]|nr:hypothetical protein [Methylococcaceae bacterium]